MNLWFVIGEKSYFIDRKASAHAVHEHSRGVLPLLPDVRRLCGKHLLAHPSGGTSSIRVQHW